MIPLNNNRGVALVLLIVAMTLISVLATSLVSIVADKNKSMVYSYDGFHASIIADSGAAFAIRYISDGLSDTSKPYFDNLLNNGGSIQWTYFSSVYKLPGVTDPIGKFKVTRTFSTTISDDNVVVESDYNRSMATRKVKISAFRRFLSPITFYPDYDTRPVRQGNRINVRVIGNHQKDLTISKIELVAPSTAPTDVYLKYVNAYSATIFAFDSVAVQTAYATRDCAVDPTTPCLDSTKGLKLTKGDYTLLEGLSSHILYNDNTNYYYRFIFDSAPYIDPYHPYIIRFTSTDGSSTWQPELKFTLTN